MRIENRLSRLEARKGGNKAMVWLDVLPGETEAQAVARATGENPGAVFVSWKTGPVNGGLGGVVHGG